MKKRMNAAANELDRLFDFAQPKEWELILWEWYKSTVTGNFDTLSSKEKLNLTKCYEIIAQFMKNMAAYSQKD